MALTYGTDGSGEMLLTRELPEIFLANQVYRRNSQLFKGMQVVEVVPRSCNVGKLNRLSK